MNIAYIGSCLSGSVVSALLEEDHANKLVGGLSHMRLDCLHEHWVRKMAFYPDKKTAQGILADLEKKGQLNKNPQRLSGQTIESLNDFQNKLRGAECLVIDNNYDLSSRLWEISHGGLQYRLSNLQIKDDVEGVRKLGMANLSGVSRLYQELFDYIRGLNANMQIIFLQYPTSGWEKAGASGRIERARTTSMELEKVRNIICVPLVDIDQNNLSEKGAHYFSGHVYRVYAKAIIRLAKGEDAPSWLRERTPFSQLKNWVEPESEAALASSEVPKESTNPYDRLPERQFWKPAVAERYPLSISRIYDKKYSILAEHRISTFGSCFAQHVGRRLKDGGFNFLDLEPAPLEMPVKERAKNGYGLYSARYGNVYTSLQMLQLYQQAFGEKSFNETWERDGRYYDPFRPNIFPDGFPSPEEVLQERTKHLSIVRTIFETSDVIVLTMGLTECWRNLNTGAVYPTAPGVTVGKFDPAVHGFRNLGFTEVKQHMLDLLEGIAQINPCARLLLTISPVPLTGTYEDRHVLLSTMHSKSVLRAVAGELAAQFEHVDYYPSYEIIMSPPFRSMFFKNNLRSIHDEGVDFVMSHFFKAHGEFGLSEAEGDSAGGDFCDEAFLELSKKSGNDLGAN